MRRMLVLDSAYTLEMITERKLDKPVLSRDLGGYFEHVWSVHPYATIIPPKDVSNTLGGLTKTNFSAKHTIIEAKIGRFKLLKIFPLLNFILSQTKLLIELGKLIKKEKIDVIRSGDPYYISLLGLLLSRIYKIPLVIRVNADYDQFYKETGRLALPRLFKKRWIEKKIERFVLKRADLVGATNEASRVFAIRNGAKKENTTLFRYGNLIHSSHLIPPQERPCADAILEGFGLWNTPFLIYVARLYPVKRQDHVLKVVAQIKKKGINIKAVLVGDGSTKASLIELARELSVDENIVFAGNRDQEWIATILPRATAVLSPHSGRALSEAGFAGAPIVAYNFEWQSELIITGQTGELVENNDVSGMADAVVKYINNPDYAKRMGENVRVKALRMMDPAKLCEHEKNEYKKLFARYK